ncbi:MAG TPA: efflux transporter outer membrane subunit [Gammaproteobacteria bacterium]|jgi:NodT family efflux transporter outer membrane factor (OMF) lipoprotein|nr:efflux transporter outer membrane subunit [Gammaproteobacteria bacterium]
MNPFTLRAGAVGLLIAVAVGGCAIGPDYKKPDVEAPAAYKEQGDWKPAAVAAMPGGGQWWKIYSDPVLDDLEAQVEVSNQNLKAADAAFRQAEALVDQARASYFPNLNYSLDRTRSRGASISNSAITGTTGGARIDNQYSISLGASWVPDIWGKVRRTVESDVAHAQASAAELAGARLSAQASLASDYFQLRIDDEQIVMLNETVAGYQASLQITQNQYQAGIVSEADVASAESQLEAAQAQAINLQLQRSLLEHAIAVLAGKPPALLDIQPLPPNAALNVPVLPTDAPSTLLERRPDVVAAERNMAAANAGIGVAEGGYFPDLTISASDGFENSVITKLISAPNRVWAVGAELAGNLFNFGATHAQVKQAEAGYDGVVADYRQTVLTAFQQVEDQLATLRFLEQEAVTQDSALQAAKNATRIARNQYKAGIVAYTNVVVAETTELNEEQTAFSIRANRLIASVSLVEALGGGWGADQAMQMKEGPADK